MNNVLKRRLEQVRHRMWVVLAIALLCIAAAAVPSLTADPTYTGKSTLMISSPGRATDQDAYIAVAYATLLNDPATIMRLKASEQIPESVTFEARTAAASPILTIEATADDAAVAQNAAQSMAAAFRDDINSAQQKDKARQIDDLERQLADLSTVPAPDNLRLSDGSAPWNPSVVSLQDRINTLRLDSTNQLQVLQPRAGVIESKPNLPQNLVFGAVGGLLLGVIAALGLAAVSTRLTTPADLRDKTGVEPLVEIPSGGSLGRDRLREDRFRTLINLVTLEDLPKSPVVALTDSRGLHQARDIAEELATVSAQQGYRTALVHAYDHPTPDANHAGFLEALTDSSRVHTLLREVNGDFGSLEVLPFGGASVDGCLRLTRERVVAILDELRTRADLIVIAAPPISETVRTEIVCGAADLTLLVVSSRSSRTGDVTSAAEALTKAHANLLGAVRIDEKNGRPVESPSAGSEQVAHLAP